MLLKESKNVSSCPTSFYSPVAQVGSAASVNQADFFDMIRSGGLVSTE